MKEFVDRLIGAAMLAALAGAALAILAGCANIYHPRLPGPAEEVDCRITRSGGLIGEYECNIKGKYELRDSF